MKKMLIIGVMAAFSSACAVNQYPAKRPMTAEYQQKIGQGDVVLSDNNLGIGVTWYRQDSSSAGAQYGLIGGLVTGIIDAIANAGPSARASKAAEELADVVTVESLNQAFVENFSKAKNAQASVNHEVTLGDIKRKGYLDETPVAGNLSIVISYLMSQEASSIKMTAYVSYSDESLTYKSPYEFKGGKAPKSQIGGPIYSNSFVYESDRLPFPEFSEALKEELIAQINERYLDENGNGPEPKSDEYKKMQRELDDANDDTLSKSEASIFLIRNWLKNDGELAVSEINKAHHFLIKQVVQDLNRTDVPSFEGQEDVILETHDDGRVVRMVGSGYGAGSIVSNPGGLDEFASYGNATSYSKANLENLRALEKQKKAKK